MNDANSERLRPLEDFTLADLEAIRLILRGDSVIDWRKLDLTGDDDVREFLRLAAEIPLAPEVQEFALSEANQALLELKTGNVRGAKVLRID